VLISGTGAEASLLHLCRPDLRHPHTSSLPTHRATGLRKGFNASKSRPVHLQALDTQGSLREGEG
jgi:hypothetical protein